MRLNRIPFTMGVVLLIGLSGCGGDDAPTTIPDPLRAPPVPTDLGAVLGEDGVSLTWEIASLGGVAGFGVYRADNASIDTVLVDTSATTAYQDDGLVPGRTYSYQVTSIGDNRIESNLSAAILVTPGTFGLVINDRAEFTATRTVNLVFTTPGDAASIMVANDSDFTGSFFEAFTSSRGWLLEEGDGTKTVYVQFRTASGTLTDVFTDEIMLDTEAKILSFTESSGGAILEPGDTLSLVMKTGEPGGTASFTLPGVLVSEPLLYDEASATYRTDFVIRPGVEVDTTVLIGEFVDRAGNIASDVTTETGVTIAETGGDPEAVLLSAPTEIGPDWIALSWSVNGDLDFARYRVFRGTVPSVEAEDRVIGVITDRHVTTLVDSSGLLDATTYYYRVFVEDRDGRIARSNEVAGTTENVAPVAVTLFEAAAADSPSTDVTLTWSAVDPSTVHDFAAYELRRSTDEAVSRLSDLVTTISAEIFTRTLTDETSDQATNYFYRLYVVDEGGLASGSEVVSVLTTDLDPTFVSLGNPNVDLINQNVSLSWQQNPDPDFASYVIYRHTDDKQTTPSPGSFTRIDTLNSQVATTYADYPEVVETPFYVQYFIEAVDRGGNRTASNIVQAVFSDAGLPTIASIAVTAGETSAVILVRTDVPTEASVRWGLSPTTLDVGSDESRTQQIAHILELESLVANTEYFYQITVTDVRNVSNFSDVLSFTTQDILSAP